MSKLKNRNAIRILEINDYPKEVIQEAIEISKELDKMYLSAKDYMTLHTAIFMIRRLSFE